MNTTFLTWVAVAAVVGGVLLLLLATPASEQVTPLTLESVTEAPGNSIESSYWEPAAPVAATPVVVQYAATRSQPVQPCGSCGAMQHAAAAPVHVQQAPTQFCGTCGTAHASLVVPACAQQPAMTSCSQRIPSPCGPVPCSGLPAYCGAPCGNTCPLNKPGINRNMKPCVDECTFVQLHATIPHPICPNVKFEWSTSKGSFLDPTSSDPMYFVPTTHFPDGEDVWVVVTITDGSGAQYTDQLKLHVENLR
jgi:hypothetical protein